MSILLSPHTTGALHVRAPADTLGATEQNDDPGPSTDCNDNPTSRIRPGEHLHGDHDLLSQGGLPLIPPHTTGDCHYQPSPPTSSTPAEVLVGHSGDKTSSSVSAVPY